MLCFGGKGELKRVGSQESSKKPEGILLENVKMNLSLA